MTKILQKFLHWASFRRKLSVIQVKLHIYKIKEQGEIVINKLTYLKKKKLIKIAKKQILRWAPFSQKLQIKRITRFSKLES